MVRKKMDISLKEKWLKALRSGRYIQARGGLKFSEGGKPAYCCLGVLCNVSKLGRWNVGDEYIIRELGRAGISSGTLGGEMLKQSGLTLEAQGVLVSMNDQTHKNFKEIADWVEKNL